MKAHNSGYLTAEQHNAIKSVMEGWAWPGGYAMHLIMDDGECLCRQCVRDNLRLIVSNTKDGANQDWKAVASAINWEDSALRCAHCNKPIPAEYEV